MTPQEKSLGQQALEKLKTTHHRVDYDIAAGMVKAFRAFVGALSPNKKDARPSIPECLTFNKTAIQEILDKPGCVALRMYPAIKEENGAKTFTLVLVGVDDDGENLIIKPTEFVKGAAQSATISAKTASTTGSGGSGTYDETQTCPPYPKPDNDF
jgi:hypothetical protein